MTMDHIAPVELEKSYRLVNHGPTVLVSARHDGVDDVMAAAWVCGLDYSPAKLTVVLDSSTMTRKLLEASGKFVIQVPTFDQAKLTYVLGHTSLHNDPDKLAKSGVELLDFAGHDQPFVAGCSAWLACRLLPEPDIQNRYDLFFGEIIAAWADRRVFRDGHWRFGEASSSLRSIHYVAGGQFYAIGDSIDVSEDSKT